MSSEKENKDNKEKTLREKQKEGTRQRVFEAALTVFRKHGVRECRIEDIAKLAGVSRGTFYFHYPTREDVIIELLKTVESGVVDALSELPSTTPLIQVLERLGDLLADRWQDDPVLLREVVVTGLRLGLFEPTDRSSDHLREALTPRFHSAAQRGELQTKFHPDLVADMFLTNLMATLLAWSGMPDISLHSLLQALPSLFLYGMARPPEE